MEENKKIITQEPQPKQPPPPPAFSTQNITHSTHNPMYNEKFSPISSPLNRSRRNSRNSIRHSRSPSMTRSSSSLGDIDNLYNDNNKDNAYYVNPLHN